MWTDDVAHGLEIAAEIRAGTYGINMYMLDTSARSADSSSPASGANSDPEGLSEYVELQSTVSAGKLPDLS